jgi:predicted nucleic acid-binding protein
MIVIDASAVVELLLNTSCGRRIGERIMFQGDSLHAPSLLYLEVAQVIRKFVRLGDVDELRGSAAVEDLRNLDLEACEHRLLLPRVWQLRENLTAYDASYVALAEALDVPLVTTDQRLAGSSGHRALIEFAQ